MQSLVEELRSNTPYGQKPKTLARNNIVTNFMKTLKIVHIKKNKPLKINKAKTKASSSVALATFPVLESHVWLMATILESAHIEHFHHCRNVLGDKGFLGCSVVKNLPANDGNSGSIPGSGRSLGEGKDNSLQYSCLENPMDWEAWWATVPGVAKSQAWLND